MPSRGGALGARNSSRLGGVDSKTRRVRVKCARALLVIAAFALLLPGSRVLAEPAPESAEVEALNADVARLYRKGRLDEAIALAERALSIQERALGPDHPGRSRPDQQPRFALPGRAMTTRLRKPSSSGCSRSRRTPSGPRIPRSRPRSTIWGCSIGSEG